MKIRLWHRIGAALLIAFSTTGTMSCSSDQQQLEDAVQQGSEDGEDGEQGNANESNEGYEGDAGANLAAQQVPAQSKPDELQEIIDGMNSQKPPESEVAPIAELPPAEPPPAPEVSQQAAVGMAAAPGLPELGSKMSYVIKRGDTLASVAMKIYGDMEKWREIAEFTGMANPNMIYPGDVIYYQLTDQTMSFSAAYESLKRSSVVVQPGDTLSTISSKVLGRSTDWKMIWRQNDNIDNPDRLIVGQTIYYVDPGMLLSDVQSSQPQPALVAEVNDNNQSQSSELSAETLNSVQSEFDTEFVALQNAGFNRLI